jgi:hypothetical protein
MRDPNCEGFKGYWKLPGIIGHLVVDLPPPAAHRFVRHPARKIKPGCSAVWQIPDNPGRGSTLPMEKFGNPSESWPTANSFLRTSWGLFCCHDGLSGSACHFGLVVDFYFAARQMIPGDVERECSGKTV